MLDARERSQAATLHAQVDAIATPDVFDRHLLGDGGGRFRIDDVRGSGTAATIASEDGIRWSQVGLGAGIGILLALLTAWSGGTAPAAGSSRTRRSSGRSPAATPPLSAAASSCGGASA